ncbi:hypothetical protein PUN28_005867 [Cardiocondyla obscurior]|uniref:Uncharacterized protein n=1 Tax=Cardiocondyla obscurior TaxID=286306 RepID=A0AAW2G7M0_9HYME
MIYFCQLRLTLYLFFKYFKNKYCIKKIFFKKIKMYLPLAREFHYILPFTPSSPGRPGNPCRPESPNSPFEPCDPRSPISPYVKFVPGSPRSPLLPTRPYRKQLYVSISLNKLEFND